jgi:peptidoglycan/xylan/chitin deacetylase (PgdA/CDA1 family)
MNLKYFIISSFLLSSCAGNKVVDNVKNNTNKMAAMNLSVSPSERTPSSSFLASLDRLENIFVRAEATLGDYDKELDESVVSANNITFDNSKHYKKMIVIWGISHRLQDKISYQYLALIDMASDKNKSLFERRLAKGMLYSFKNKLDSKDALSKVSFHELKNNLVKLQKERKGISNKSMSSNDASEVPLKEEQDQLIALRANREKFRVMGKTVQNNNDELNQQIEQEANSLQLIDQKGREPQQADLKFYPSTGGSGNIMGLAFPRNVWALTYDDGPNPVHTPAIVKNLNELGVKATFFWLAENVIRYQSVVDLVKENGLAMANHSWSHPQLPKLDDVKLNKEVVQSTAVETKAYGEKPKFFRCPYGAGNSVPRVRKLIADNGMIHVFWNVDTMDWQDKDPDSIVARAQKQMKVAGHGVILFHDIHPQSVIASKKLIEWSKTFKGTDHEIRWVTLPEIAQEMNGEIK